MELSRYIVAPLALCASPSLVLQLGPWRHALLGNSDDPSLLIATLTMTSPLCRHFRLPWWGDIVLQ
jgi:hypothetical protein